MQSSANAASSRRRWLANAVITGCVRIDLSDVQSSVRVVVLRGPLFLIELVRLHIRQTGRLRVRLHPCTRHIAMMDAAVLLTTIVAAI